MDQTRKRQNLARALCQAAPNFMDSMRQMEGFAQQATAAGLVFSDADFNGITGLEHLNAATINTALTTIATIGNAMRTNNFDDVLEALRP